jgi:hypothetical protein
VNVADSPAGAGMNQNVNNQLRFADVFKTNDYSQPANVIVDVSVSSNAMALDIVTKPVTSEVWQVTRSQARHLKHFRLHKIGESGADA